MRELKRCAECGLRKFMDRFNSGEDVCKVCVWKKQMNDINHREIFRLSDIHGCPKCQGKIITIEMDNIGNTYCGYCHDKIDINIIQQWINNVQIKLDGIENLER